MKRLVIIWVSAFVLCALCSIATIGTVGEGMEPNWKDVLLMIIAVFSTPIAAILACVFGGRDEETVSNTWKDNLAVTLTVIYNLLYVVPMILLALSSHGILFHPGLVQMQGVIEFMKVIQYSLFIMVGTTLAYHFNAKPA